MKTSKQKKIEFAIMIIVLIIDLILFMDLRIHKDINVLLNNLETIFINLF